MQQRIDLARCVWDMAYRRMVKAILNAEPVPTRQPPANQNDPAPRPGSLPHRG